MNRSVIWIMLALFCFSAVQAQDETEPKSWYPRTIAGENGSVVIYAPQIDGWQDFEIVSARAAFRVTTNENPVSYFGALEFRAKTDTDLGEREVLLHDLEIVDLSIEGLSEESAEFGLVRDGFVALSRKVPLDLVLAYLPRDVELESSAGLNSSPPTIFLSESPAILLFVDSEPRYLPIEYTDLQFVLNTTWDVIRDGETGPHYLCYSGNWLTADTLGENWVWARSLPGELRILPAGPNWDGARNCLPDDLENLVAPDSEVPTVFYSQTAAELLLFDGAPAWAAINDTGLSFANNSSLDLFRYEATYYLLLSGRWFTARSLDGPWTLAERLPYAFEKIPAEDSATPHEKSYVRSSIPGTEEAWEAALVVSIPRKAEILRDSENALDINVTYAGEPAFAPIENTEIELAANTSYQVLQYDDIYYLCYNATWLTSSDANGPWIFADSIPDEFASIPPSSPAYNTTFVSIDDSDEESINYEYTSGYEGSYVSEDTVVQGTGYVAPAVTVALIYGASYAYPYYPYYWWPPTYGYGSWYNPETGRYGQSAVAYGPYGAAGGAAVYNPETGVYGRGQAVWDNDEFAGRGYAYNPNTNTSIARNRYIDFDDNEGWSQNVARRGDEWRYSESEWKDGRLTTDYESSRGTEGSVTRERQGDTIVSEGTVSGENRSATYESIISDGQLSGQIEGSEGGSGTVDRQLDNGEISGESSFSKDGKTLDTDVTRDAEGVSREFETSAGGQGVSKRSGEDNAFAFQSGDGDAYAGKDGNVYKKTEEGWSKIENPTPNSASRNTTSTATDQYSRELNRDRQSRQKGYSRFDRYQSGGRNNMQRNSGYRRRR